jgi:hypothetical protein
VENSCKHSNEASGYIKFRTFLAASQEQLSSVKVVSISLIKTRVYSIEI